MLKYQDALTLFSNSSRSTSTSSDQPVMSAFVFWLILITVKSPNIMSRSGNRSAKSEKNKTGLYVIKLFSSSTQLSMKFKPLINVAIAKINGISRFKSWHQSQSFILPINIKMPTFMSRINFMLSWVEHKKFYKLLPKKWDLSQKTVFCVSPTR